MKRLLLLLLLPFTCILTSCAQRSSAQIKKKTTKESELKGLSTAVFASGCFWATEGKFESVVGVKESVAGYTGGNVKAPSYEAVCSETTGHAEAIKVYYDPKIVSYNDLLKVYFSGIDPTQVDGQGPDHGSSYRSAIFYGNDAERMAAAKYMSDIKGKYKSALAVQLNPLTTFWKAENYHQDYIYGHMTQGYIQGVSVPKIKKFQQEFPAMVKKDFMY